MVQLSACLMKVDRNGIYMKVDTKMEATQLHWKGRWRAAGELHGWWRAAQDIAQSWCTLEWPVPESLDEQLGDSKALAEICFNNWESQGVASSFLFATFPCCCFNFKAVFCWIYVDLQNGVKQTNVRWELQDTFCCCLVNITHGFLVSKLLLNS